MRLAETARFTSFQPTLGFLVVVVVVVTVDQYGLSIDLYNQSHCPTHGRLSSQRSFAAITLAFYITVFTRKLFNQFFFHACHAYSHYSLPPFYTTFTGLDLGWGHKVSTKQSLFHFLTFQQIKMKFEVMVKQFRQNILILCLSVSY